MSDYTKLRDRQQKELNELPFTITERTEPFTLDEVFSFIDDTNISKMDACELKSRIVDVVQAERNKGIDVFAERLASKIKAEIDDCADELDWIAEIAEQMKGK